MVDFGKSDYFHSMDRPEQLNLRTNELGVSSKIGDVHQGFKADVQAGASHVEIVFQGTGKGSLQGQTNPGIFGKDKRNDIRMMGKLNGVTVSTHAAVTKAGWSGFNAQSRKFSRKEAQEGLTELKRTIDFAADAAGGGPVTIHTGEFPRSVSDDKFTFGDENEQEVYLANSRTGEIMAFNKNMNLHEPVWKKDSQGRFLGVDGRPLQNPNDLLQRAIEFDEQGNGKFVQKNYNDVKKEIDQWNKSNPNHKRNADMEFFKLSQRDNWQRTYSMGQASLLSFRRSIEAIEELDKDYREWTHYENKIKDPESLEKFKRSFEHHLTGGRNKSILKGDETPSEYLKKKLNEAKDSAIREKEGYQGYQKEIEKLEQGYKDIKSIQEVGVQRSAEALAEAAMYAYDVKESRNKKGENIRTITVCPENMFAEFGYGAHPQELKKLIQSSRKEMVEMLERKGIKGKKAESIAAEHLKATFDIAHANTWYKYFNGDKKQFDKWLVGEVNQLSKEGIIGHAHISDNFGYSDEHLTPGQGNTPIKEFIKTLKDHGYEGKIITEWGAQGQDEAHGTAMLGAWAELANSPIYRIEGGSSAKWNDIEHAGYFGATSSPNTMVGRYATALGKDWQMWSYTEAPLE